MVQAGFFGAVQFEKNVNFKICSILCDLLNFTFFWILPRCSTCITCNVGSRLGNVIENVTQLSDRKFKTILRHNRN